jgi:hypothetical protein
LKRGLTIKNLKAVFYNSSEELNELFVATTCEPSRYLLLPGLAYEYEKEILSC